MAFPSRKTFPKQFVSQKINYFVVHISTACINARPRKTFGEIPMKLLDFLNLILSKVAVLEKLFLEEIKCLFLS